MFDMAVAYREHSVAFQGQQDTRQHPVSCSTALWPGRWLEQAWHSLTLPQML